MEWMPSQQRGRCASARGLLCVQVCGDVHSLRSLLGEIRGRGFIFFTERGRESSLSGDPSFSAVVAWMG